ncbi:MAG: alkaline phosphatase family protein [Candidatus Hydrothermarchaeaceae archaeon]
MQDASETRESCNAKVFVVGLDGATLDLIMPWVMQGKLPTLKRLMDAGASGELTSTILPISAPAWVSFVTGKNPGKHNVFDFMERGEGSYDQVPVNSRSRDGKAVWNLLNDAGKKVGLINIPVTYPSENVDAFMITGFPTPDTKGGFVHPRTLLLELEERFGNFKLHPDEIYTPGKEDVFIESVYEVTEKTMGATLYLMEKYEWDFFMTVFGGTDILSHWFWKYMDPDHPEYDAKEAEKYGNVIEGIYQKIDENIGEILERLDEDTTVIIMSDHGFGPVHKSLYLNNWLKDIGLLKLKKNRSTRIKYWLFRHGLVLNNIFKLSALVGFAKHGKKSVATSQRSVDMLKKLFISFLDIDWSLTKAYSTGNFGQIFINVKGREPRGIVEPGREYGELREFIIGELYKLKDPESGEKIIDRVYKREEIYSGGYLEQAPDLLLLSRDMKYITTRYFEFASNMLVAPPTRMTSGNHKMNGTLIMKGRNIKKGAEIQGANIIDIVPTILGIMGVPVPADMDGEVLTEIFEESFLAKTPIRYRGKDEKGRIRNEIRDLKALGRI